jgi:hypothetical protein
MRIILNMKTHLIPLAICLAGSLGPGLYRASAELEVSAGVSIHATADFYEPLGTRGTWVEVGSYGRCWHPAGVVVGWRPYCDGYWEWTDCGWYWVSDEPWAWACYHYGTWAYDPNFGWVWVPGVEWSPAWVYWRTGGDHIGWAPCGPVGFVVEPSFFVFVESRNFHERIRPGTVIINNETIIRNTTEITSNMREQRRFDGKTRTVTVNHGPSVDVVEKATGKKFAAVSVREADRHTLVSVPEKIKHPAAEPAPTEKPHTVQEPAKPAPAKNPDMPQNVSPKKEMPVEKEIPPEMKTPQAPPERKIIPPETPAPQTPPERIVPPANRDLPLDKEQRHPNEVAPPVHQPQQPVPVAPPGNQGNQGSHENGQDKDHGHDNL